MGGRLGAHAASGLLTRFGRARPAGLSWALPAVVAVELIGSTFGAPFVFSALFFASVVAILFRERAVFGCVSSRRGRRIAGCIAATLGLASTWMGLPNTGAPELRVGSDVRLALAFLGCLCVASAIPWCARRRASWRDLERFGCLVAASFAWLLASGHRVQRLAVLPDHAAAGAVAFGAVIVLLVLAATAGRWHGARLGVLLAVGLGLRVLGLATWQPDPNVRDMLPLVQAAGDALARGDSPYGLYAMQRGSVVPLTYLPGLWLLHDLPTWIGLPLRTTSLLADAAVVLALWWAASGRAGLVRWRARCLTLSLAAVWFLSPSVQWNAIYAEPHPYWGVLALLLAASVRGRFTLAAALLGLAIATRQFAWVVAPFWLWWAVREQGFGRALAQLLVTGAVALALLVPFVSIDPDAFWFGTLHWFADYGSAHRTWFLTRLGFAGTFYAGELQGWLIPLEAAAALGGLAVVRLTVTPSALMGVMAATYTLVIMLCPVIWSSFYLDCFVVVSLAVLVSTASSSSAPRRELSRWYGLPLALEGLGLCWLAYGFLRATSEWGLSDARAALVGQARPGDVLVDRGKQRLAFIQPPLFEAAPQARVVASEFDASLSDAGVLSAPRVGLLFRESRDAPLARRFAQLGAVVSEGSAHEYGWLWVEPAPVLGRLSAGFAGGAGATDVRETSCRVGGRLRRMLFAHPSDQGALELEFVAPPGARRLVLLAGLDDRIVLWGRSDVTLSVVAGETAAGELRIRNLPGIQWAVFSFAPTPPKRIKLVLETPDDRQRWLCLDGTWR